MSPTWWRAFGERKFKGSSFVAVSVITVVCVVAAAAAVCFSGRCVAVAAVVVVVRSNDILSKLRLSLFVLLLMYYPTLCVYFSNVFVNKISIKSMGRKPNVMQKCF